MNSEKRESVQKKKENRIQIDFLEKEIKLLPMEGIDSSGNRWQVDNLSFLRNDKRFLPVMGEFHFSRYEPDAWEEELLKMRAGGIKIVATYVFWIHHEEKREEWNFSGCRNLRRFLKICRKIEMPVWLRIGPWAHGECRNGGFPDWVAEDKTMKVRTNDPAYLKLVKAFYQKLGEQASGMMCKDGGPVIGIQLENEYGHCGGPDNRKEGMDHIRILKCMAQEAGFDVPYYTVTGWGGAYVVEGETLPVLGGYVDAPWAEHVEKMPASENFVFSSYKQDGNIGSDLKRKDYADLMFDPSRNPYLTAELGSGIQVTSHRRPWPSPEDIEAQTICMLGSGANLLGYYMYHGGINPDGKYSTLQESRETGYNNDLPVKSYDFQTCIRESGEIFGSFGKLKKIHLMLEDFGEDLAGTMTFFPDKQPESPEDLHTLRVAARVNSMTGAGFLFVNNHQRHRKMEAHRNAVLSVQFSDHEVEISGLDLEDGDCGVIPFNFPFGETVLETTNVFLLCRLGERIFFYTGNGYSGKTEIRFVWKNGKADNNIVILSGKEADRAFRIGKHLYVTEKGDDCLIEQEENIYLITKAEKEKLKVYSEKGEAEYLPLEAQGGPAKVPVWFEPVKGQTDHLYKQKNREKHIGEYLEYCVHLEYPEQKNYHELYLEADYLGDRAEIYVEDKLADDWFTNGEKWHIALKRLSYPSEILIRIYSTDYPIPNPHGNRVYYDLPVKKGCGLLGVKIIPEYKLWAGSKK